MKKIVLALFLFWPSYAATIHSGGVDILKKMYTRYHGKWYKTLSFNQSTEMYRHDSLMRTEIWYENIQFPDDFRIDFGHPDSGNAVIFKRDSAFVFRNGIQAEVRVSEDDLLFLLGGLYFYPFDTVVAKMTGFGYDLDQFREDTWKGRPVYVIGASNQRDSLNQLWVEKENYCPVRLIKFSGEGKQEALFENHVKLGGGFTETLVHFFINDQLIQVEKYHDLRGDGLIDRRIFDTEKFVTLKRQVKK